MVGGVCTLANLTSDVNNWLVFPLFFPLFSRLVLTRLLFDSGGIGIKCIFTNGVGSCLNSKCTISTCNTGYTLVNNVCSIVNLQTNVRLFPPPSLVSRLALTLIRRQKNNCGAAGVVCPATYANGGAGVCTAGVCGTTCNALYAFDVALKYCRPVGTDVRLFFISTSRARC